MERAIAEMEKIKRAEEIYSRRKNLEEDKKNTSKSIYKILFEILFFINIVIIILAIQNQNYIFTKDFIKQVNSYNVNVKKKVEEFFSSSENVNKSNSKKQNKTVVDKNNTENNNVNNNEGISGESNNVTSALVENEEKLQSEEKSENEKQSLNEETNEGINKEINEEMNKEINGKTLNELDKENLTQEELDILEIKNNYSVILPVNGVKTSGFGERESSNKKVTKNHTGIDIAASKGTKILSAITGTVIQVSSSGDYGKHVKVQNGELVVLYAHCSEIYVKEGQEVKQEEVIGAVGSTGNSTGPHLHFEIKIHDRLVNPEGVISL